MILYENLQNFINNFIENKQNLMINFCLKRNNKTQLLDNSSFGNAIKITLPFLINYSRKQRIATLYRCFQNLGINETNHLLYYIPETKSPKSLLPLSIFLVKFLVAHTHDLSGHPGREKTHAAIKERYYFPKYSHMNYNTYTRLSKMLNEQIHAKSSYDPTTAFFRSLTILQPSYFNGHTRTNIPVFGWEFLRLCHCRSIHIFVVLHPSSKSATNALTVLFDQWIVKFGIPDILTNDNGNEYINGEFAHFCRT